MPAESVDLNKKDREDGKKGLLSLRHQPIERCGDVIYGVRLDNHRIIYPALRYVSATRDLGCLSNVSLPDQCRLQLFAFSPSSRSGGEMGGFAKDDSG